VTLLLSIPDALAAAAQRAATERRMTTSELYARAVAAFLKSHEGMHTEKVRPLEGADPVWSDGWEPRPG
jgi:hypothetical protein